MFLYFNRNSINPIKAVSIEAVSVKPCGNSNDTVFVLYEQ